MAIRTVAALALVLVSAGARVAGAQPIEPLGDLPDGSLRINLHCADYWATPATGLRVTVDGGPADPTGTNGATVIGYGKHGLYETWVPTDIGYSVPPGVHHIELAAPDCASEAHDIAISPRVPRFVTGRLAIATPDLRGTTGAPNHIGFAIGLGMAAVPARSGTTTLGSSATAYRSDAATEKGLWLSTSYEHRRLAIAWDIATTGGSTTGTMHEVAAPFPAAVASGGMAYDETVIDMTSALRIGMRVPMHDLALAAGSGVGGTMRMHFATASAGSDPFAQAPSGLDATWFVPVWASLTVKPSCNLGVQLLASYDVHPGDAADNGATIGAGLLWQPNNACADSPGVRIR